MGPLCTLLLSLLALCGVQGKPYAIGKAPCPAIEVVPSHMSAAALEWELAEGWKSESSRYVLVVRGGESQLDPVRSGSGVCKGSGYPTERKTTTVGNAMLKECGLSLKANATTRAALGDGSITCIQNGSAEVSGVFASSWAYASG